jgi:hypothetical protein
MKLEPKAAADAIRGRLALHLEPVEMHRVNYVNEVCHHLGIEPNHLNHLRVLAALEANDIDTGGVQEYPQWVDVDDETAPEGKRAVLVESKEEHDALCVPQPEPETRPTQE